MTETARIPLRDRAGEVKAWALVDAADYEELAKNRWCMNNNGYAVRGIKPNGRRKLIPMHRQLLGLSPGDGLQGDHINGDRLDNRRANLRIVTNAENAQNRRHGGRGLPRGVYLHRRSGRFIAAVTLNYKSHHLGYFSTARAAGEAAAAFRAKHMPCSAEATS